MQIDNQVYLSPLQDRTRGQDIVLSANIIYFDTFDITVKESIKKANILDYYKKNFKYIISGNV